MVDCLPSPVMAVKWRIHSWWYSPILMYTRARAASMPTESPPSQRTWGTPNVYFVSLWDLTSGRLRAPPAARSGASRLPTLSRSWRLKMALTGRELMMLSDGTKEVSTVPGRSASRKCQTKLSGVTLAPKTRPNQKYCAPMVADSSSILGFSGSAGARSGCGATWQKAHAIPTRYGRTSLRSL
jgi:hypothetical protein